MKTTNILSRISEFNFNLLSQAPELTFAIQNAKYKDSTVGRHLLPEEVLEILLHSVISVEDSNSDADIKSLYETIFSKVIDTDEFKSVVVDSTKKSLGIALMSIGLDFYQLEDNLNQAIDSMLNDGTFDDESMDFVGDNAYGVTISPENIKRIKDLVIPKVIDDSVLIDYINSYRKGLVDELIFFILLDSNSVSITDIVNHTTNEEFTKIMSKIKDIIDSQKAKDNKTSNSSSDFNNIDSESISSIEDDILRIIESSVKNKSLSREELHKDLRIKIKDIIIKHFDMEINEQSEDCTLLFNSFLEGFLKNVLNEFF